ncbi:MAG: RNA polymerase sigma factor [Anaerolineae bacterium]|nr:RNA polymerase sigma factor [Anaerolineae bacterium]
MENLLIQRLQQGDLEALGELYERHKNLVFRTALAVTRDQRAAEDILQECFVRLYTYSATVDGERPLEPWLYRVTLNLAYDWSSRTRWTQPVDDLLEWLSGLPAVFSAPDSQAEKQETIALVREVIAGLPATHRAVVVLFYLEDLSLEEIGRILNLPTGTVKSRLYYARERLRKTLTRRQRPVPEMGYEFT